MGIMMQLLVSALLGGVAFVVVARLVPGFELKGGFGSAIVAGIVYGILKALLQKLFIVATLPAVMLSFGLFILVINAFLLWLTDKLVDGFEVKSKGGLVFGALLLSVADMILMWVFQQGALF